MTLSYETVFSRTLSRINDVQEVALETADFEEIYIERLHSVIGNPRVRRLFSYILFDDDFQEINFRLANPVDDDSDTDFVCRVFVIGMTIEWLSPKVDSLEMVIQQLGGKEEKMLNNPYKTLQSRLENAKKELNKLICDHGYLYNSYINEGS